MLVFGSNGQVGSEVCSLLSALGPLVSLDRSNADLSDPESLRALVRQHRPTVIINAAAYTAVDRAEAEPELAFTVNAISPGVLAEEAEACGACLVHYSTDYVFDGRSARPYREDDTTDPLSVYGRTKRAGEQAVVSACARHVILRTSWVVGAHGSNFLKTVLRLAAERDSLRVVADQFGAPTSARLIARVTERFVQRLAPLRGDRVPYGTYHLAAGGETSWHAYAQYAIARGHQSGIRLRASAASVAPISTNDYPVAARRPASSRLDTAKLRGALRMDLPEWTQCVDEVIEELTFLIT
ncbi:MAG: rfbD [Gemmatimonadetes bacterium]|nr:rfbD [Gemmatimonadota bacterium]